MLMFVLFISCVLAICAAIVFLAFIGVIDVLARSLARDDHPTCEHPEIVGDEQKDVSAYPPRLRRMMREHEPMGM